MTSKKKASRSQTRARSPTITEERNMGGGMNMGQNPMGAGMGMEGGMPPMGGGGMPPMGGGGMPPMGGGMGAGQPQMTPKPQKLNPLQQKYMATVRDLTEQASNLVIKVATCKCDKREECKLFHQARKIAEKVEFLQELGSVGVPSGKGRRKAST